MVNGIDAHRVGQLFDTSNPVLNAYSNPNTSGVTFRTSWADVESADGKFDFSTIDTVFANAEKNGKWVELILIPGFGTPGWALHAYPE
jgi:beta-galactosidase GanA